MFMVYPHTKIHNRSSNGSLVITMKKESCKNFLVAAMFFLRRTKMTLSDITYFSKIYHHTKLQKPI